MKKLANFKPYSKFDPRKHLCEEEIEDLIGSIGEMSGIDEVDEAYKACRVARANHHKVIRRIGYLANKIESEVRREHGIKPRYQTRGQEFPEIQDEIDYKRLQNREIQGLLKLLRSRGDDWVHATIALRDIIYSDEYKDIEFPRNYYVEAHNWNDED